MRLDVEKEGNVWWALYRVAMIWERCDGQEIEELRCHIDLRTFLKLTTP